MARGTMLVLWAGNQGAITGAVSVEEAGGTTAAHNAHRKFETRKTCAVAGRRIHATRTVGGR